LTLPTTVTLNMHIKGQFLQHPGTKNKLSQFITCKGDHSWNTMPPGATSALRHTLK